MKMYDITIVGAGICGLNLCHLLLKKGYKNILLLEKSNKVGGLIQSKYVKFNDKTNKTNKTNKKIGGKGKFNTNKGLFNRTQKNSYNSTLGGSKNNKIKYEAGAAVVFDYQTNMKNLIKEFNIDVIEIPLDDKARNDKQYWNGSKKVSPLGKSTTEKFLKLIKQVFAYMDKMGDNHCRKFTFEQICLQVLTYDETRFLEFCYGYSSEFRIANAVVAKKNMNNELFNTDKMFLFKKGYSTLIKAIFDSISNNNNATIKKNMCLNSFKPVHGKPIDGKPVHGKSFNLSLYNSKTKSSENIITKKLVLAIPREALLKMCTSFTNEEMVLFNTVEPSSLSRVFAKYDMNKKENEWMKMLKYSTVNNPIRQIIPTKKNIGLFQISYSDWQSADLWGTLSKDDCKKQLKKLLKQIFHDKKIDDPKWFDKIYWPNAIHFWKPNINEKDIHKKITHLRPNLFIGGESFSLNQAWSEGAVQTSIEISKLL